MVWILLEERMIQFQVLTVLRLIKKPGPYLPPLSSCSTAPCPAAYHHVPKEETMVQLIGMERTKHLLCE